MEKPIESPAAVALQLVLAPGLNRLIDDFAKWRGALGDFRFHLRFFGLGLFGHSFAWLKNCRTARASAGG